MEPASSNVNEETTKSGVERPPSAMVKGVRLATSMIATNESGTMDLDRVSTSCFGFAKPVDGDRFSLPFPLIEKLLQKNFVLSIRNPKAPALFPKEKLFCPGQKRIPQVKLKRAPVGIPVGDGVDNRVARHLVSTVLYHVSKHECFIIAQEPFIDLGLNGTGELLEPVLCIGTLDFFEEPTRSTRHSRTDHVFCVGTASYSKNRSLTLEISIMNVYLFITHKRATRRIFRPDNASFVSKLKAIPLDAKYQS
jgi:hypothetical protein